MMILDMAMSMPQTKEYLGKIPSGLDALAKSFNTDECFIMVRKKKFETGEEKGVICIMGMVEGRLTLLSDENGKPAEYIVDESAIAMIREKMDNHKEEIDN